MFSFVTRRLNDALIAIELPYLEFYNFAMHAIVQLSNINYVSATHTHNVHLNKLAIKTKKANHIELSKCKYIVFNN